MTLKWGTHGPSQHGGRSGSGRSRMYLIFRRSNFFEEHLMMVNVGSISPSAHPDSIAVKRAFWSFFGNAPRALPSTY